MANKLTPEYLATQVAKYALEHVRMEVDSAIRDQYEGNFNYNLNHESDRTTVSVDLRRVGGIKSTLRYIISFKLSPPDPAATIVKYGTYLGKGLVRELEGHHPKAERKVPGDKITIKIPKPAGYENVRSQPKKTKKKKKKRKVKPKKVCPICGPESDDYPPWEGKCDHKNIYRS